MSFVCRKTRPNFWTLSWGLSNTPSGAGWGQTEFQRCLVHSCLIWTHKFPSTNTEINVQSRRTERPTILHCVFRPVELLLLLPVSRLYFLSPLSSLPATATQAGRGGKAGSGLLLFSDFLPSTLGILPFVEVFTPPFRVRQNSPTFMSLICLRARLTVTQPERALSLAASRSMRERAVSLCFLQRARE